MDRKSSSRARTANLRLLFGQRRPPRDHWQAFVVTLSALLLAVAATASVPASQSLADSWPPGDLAQHASP